MSTLAEQTEGLRIAIYRDFTNFIDTPAEVDPSWGLTRVVALQRNVARLREPLALAFLTPEHAHIVERIAASLDNLATIFASHGGIVIQGF